MKDFLLGYIRQHQHTWNVQPVIHEGPDFQDCIVLVFGKPRTAVFAHMDSIGFMVRYGHELVKIGSPKAKSGWNLTGEDSQGPIRCTLEVEDNGKLFYTFDRQIERGTDLVFACDFRQTDQYVQSCYLDDRLGVWNALQLAETLTDGIICFSCWEEVGGGSVQYLAKFIYEQYGVRQALISDITWVTSGVEHGKGVCVTMRDSALPRRSYVQRLLALAKESGIPHQIEVETAGGSDGNLLQSSPYPFDWCFVGAAEDMVHTPDEKVHLDDIRAMVAMYRMLMEKL